MNRSCYRIVFNKTRGLPMAVAESARRSGGAGRQEGADGPSKQRVAVTLTALAAGVLLMPAAEAQIVADRSAPGSRQATVLSTANGVLQVNIQSPSAAGVSHNVYSRFDVPAGGAILNNARSAALSQLGGQLAGNPWLAGGSARVILNEVNAVGPSQLRGYVEVGGDRAELVIANPAGIICEGCGFINASRATLTTGSPVVVNGALDGFRVQGGSILVHGAGLDASRLDYTALIARAVEANAGIWARELRVVTGAAEVSADAAAATPAAASGPAPAFALDVALLGGMYANKITLVGTEAGLGMRSAGHIGAAAGEVRITSAGWLENSGRISAADGIGITMAGSLGSSGSLLTGGQASLRGGDRVTLDGQLLSTGDATVAVSGGAGRIDMGTVSLLAAGHQADGSVGSVGTLRLEAAGEVSAHGRLLAGNALEIDAGSLDLRAAQLSAANIGLNASRGTLDLAGGQVGARDTLRAATPDLLSTVAAGVSAARLRVDAHDLNNARGELLHTGSETLAIRLAGELNNAGGRIASNGDSLQLAAATVDNRAGRIIANGPVRISAGSLDNSAGSVSTRQDVAIRAAGAVANGGGLIAGNTGVDLQSASLDNTAGRIESAEAGVRLRSGDLLNTGGQVFAATDLGIQAARLGNPDGRLYAGLDTRLELSGSLTHGGVIGAGRHLSVSAAAIDAASSSLFAAGLQADGRLAGSGILTLDVGDRLAAQGQNLAAGQARLAGATLDLSGSQTRADTLRLDARGGSLDARRAGIVATHGLQARALALMDTRQARISAEHLDLQAHSVDNTDGELLHAGSAAMALRLPGTLSNIRGRIVSNADLEIGAGTLDNRGGDIVTASDRALRVEIAGLLDNRDGGQLRAGGHASLSAGGVDNTAATLTAAKSLTVASAGVLANTGGLMAGNTGVDLQSARLDNTAGRIESAEAGVRIGSGDLLNIRGQVFAATDLSIQAAQFRNPDGSLYAGRDLSLELAGNLSHGGVIGAGRHLSVSAAAIDAASSGLFAAGLQANGLLAGSGTLTLDARDILAAHGQNLAASQASLVGASLDLSGSQTSAGSLLLDARSGSLDARRAAIIASRGLQARAASLLDTRQAKFSAGQLELQAHSLDNSAGELIQTDGADMAIQLAGTLSNNGGRIASNASTLQLGAATLANEAGRIEHSGAGTLEIRSQALAGSTGQITTNGQLDLSTGQLVLDSARTQAAKLSITADSFSHREGQLRQTGREAGRISSAGQLDNRSGLIGSHGDLTLQAGSVDNTAGRIESAAAGVHIGSGDLLNIRGQVFAATDLSIQATRLLNPDGSLQAGRDASLGLAGGLVHGGVIGAGRDVSITAGSIDATAASLFAAGLQADGRLAGSGILTLAAGSSLAAHGQNLAAGQARLMGATLDLSGSQTSADALLLDARSGSLDARHAYIVASHALQARAASLLDTRQARISAEHLEFQAHDVDNSQGELVHTGSTDMVIQLAGSLTNNGGRLTSNARNLHLGAASLANEAGRIEHSGPGTLEIRSQALAGGAGQIITNGHLDLSSGQLILDSARTQASRLSITADRFSHREGQLLQTASEAGRIRISGQLDNRAGRIAGKADLSLHAGSLDNRDGGRLSAGGTADLRLGQLDNSGGEITSGQQLAIVTTDALVNRTGLIAGSRGARLESAVLDNSAGSIAAVEGVATLLVAGQLGNLGGQVAAGQALSLSAGSVDNRLGTLSASSLSVLTGGGSIDNREGRLVASAARDSGELHIDGGQLDNRGGLIQAQGRLAVDTRGEPLINSGTAEAGGIVSAASLTLRSGDLDNRTGHIGSVGQLDIHAGRLDNSQGGTLSSQGDTTLQGRAIGNDGGRIHSLGGLDMKLAETLDNAAGLIQAGETLHILAARVLNTATQGEAQGIEARRLILGTTQLDNRDGALRADESLQITSAGSIDNTRGMISSLGSLSLTDPATAERSLAIANTTGTLIAGSQLSVQAGRLAGDGRLLSGGDIAIRVDGDFSNSGELRANGNTQLELPGTLSNRSRLASAGTLQLRAGSIANQAGSEILAGRAILQAVDSHTLTNRGLIDAGDTLLDSPTILNLGGGRIYGDHLTIRADSLNNLPENGSAPVIAARQRLDLGAGRLVNRDHALIFSAGDMAIGGALDADGFATGEAGTLTNASATIEALGNLRLAAGRIDNLDAHFATQTLRVASSNHVEYAFPADATHYRADQVYFTVSHTKDGIRTLHVLPEFSGGKTLASENFLEFSVTRSVDEEQILHADPARILAGGELHLAGGRLTNDKSGIMAGGLLSADVDALDNLGATGIRTSTDVGTVTEYWRRKRNGPDHQGSSTLAYEPAPVLQTLALVTPVLAQNGEVTGSGIAVPVSRPGGVASAAEGRRNTGLATRSPVLIEVRSMADDAGAVGGTDLLATAGRAALKATGIIPATRDASADNAGIDGSALARVSASSSITPAPSALAATKASALPQGATGSGSITDTGIAAGGVKPIPAAAEAQSPFVVRAIAPHFTLPDSSLFLTHPESGARYLVETDPRFTERKQWLSSDYLLAALAMDPSATQKRLGDGFYEQRLVREQIAQLTGRRFLDGYASDEAEYQALMAAGLTYAGEWQLRPGVALSAAQMARLTTDIVWLVETPVTLADGSVQQVLVPQVYVRIREGDIDGAGGLLSGSTASLASDASLLNTGTIAGRRLLSLSADTLQNRGGRIAGDSVLASARTDLENIGGRIEATRVLELSAGRDLTVASTTRATTSGQGRRTHLDRLASLHVSGGTLSAQAGRDLRLDANEIINAAPTAAGQTTLTAGRDLSLGTVTESRHHDVVWNARNYRKEAGTAEVGTTIDTAGGLTIQAGQNLTARAATVKADGDLTLRAGRDLRLEAGRSTIGLDAANYSRKTSLIGKKREKIHITHLEGSSATGTAVAGGRVMLGAGGDVRLEAATLSATESLAVAAGRDLTLDAAENSQRLERRDLSKNSWGLGRKTVRETLDSQRVTQVGSSLSAPEIELAAGRDIALVASRLHSQGELSLRAGQTIAYLAATEIDERRHTRTERNNFLDFDDIARDNGWRVGKRDREDSSATRRAAVTQLQSEADVVSESGGDTRLQATRIRAGSFTARAGRVDGRIVDPAARLSLEGVKESTTTYKSGSSKSFMWQRMSGEGQVTETLRLPDIQLGAVALASRADAPVIAPQAFAAPAAAPVSAPLKTIVPDAAASTPKPVMEAAGGLVVSATALAPTAGEAQAVAPDAVPVASARDPQHTLIPIDLRGQAATLAGQPGLGWLGDIARRQDVDWQAIELASRKWDYSHSGLTQEGAIVVAIAVAIVSAGTASGAGAALATEAGMTTAAGTATATSVAAAGAGVAGSGIAAGTVLTTTGLAVASATAAGISAIASQAAVSLINNKGDVSRTLEELGSKESIRQTVFSMLTAGATQGVTTALDLPNPATNAAFADRFKTFATQAAVRAGAESVVYGRPIADSLQAGLIEALTQSLTAEIGDWGKSNGIDKLTAAKMLAHAVVQCASASLSRQDCGAAALGGATAEALAPLADKTGQWGKAINTMGTLLAAKLAGEDTATALKAGRVVDGFNRQLHVDEIKWIKDNAKTFATTQGISEQEATERLVQQALKSVDYLWRAQLSDGDDAAALVYLKGTGQAFANNQGEQQEFFSFTGQQLIRPEIFADATNPNFYKDFAQSGVRRSLVVGLRKEVNDSGVSLAADAKNLVKTIKDNPLFAAGWLLNAVKNIPLGVLEGFKESGASIGEGAAVALNPDITAKLNTIYGVNVSTAQQALLAARITSAVAGAAGAARVASEVMEAAAKTLRAKAAAAADVAADAARIKQADISNNFYRDGGIADPTKAVSVSGPWKSVAELTPAEADALIASRLPTGVTVRGGVNANQENIKAILDGYQAPYFPNTQILEVSTSQPTQFVRVFGGESRQSGGWVMRAEDIQGLTPQQIAAKFSLPQVPTMVTDVTVPAGVRLNVSVANGISPNVGKNILTGDNFGGGGVQFEILTRPPTSKEFATWFNSPRPLK